MKLLPKSWLAPSKDLWFAVASGLLLTISFAPWKSASVAWFALVPLLYQLLPLDPQKKCTSSFRMGYVTGLIFWTYSIYWLGHVTIIGTACLIAFLSLYFGLWTWFLAALRARWPASHGWHHLLISFIGSCGWISIEWLRGWILGGFPWNNLAASQHQNLALIQIAEWTGIYGVSFVIIFFNISLWLTWRRLKSENFSARSWRYEFSVAILLVAFCLWMGMQHFLKKSKLPENSVALKIALIQPNIPQEVKFEPMTEGEQLDRLRQLTKMAATAKPDLIFWPETALVNGPSYSVRARFWILELLQEIKTPILFGAIDTVEVENPKGSIKRKSYNAAMFLRTDDSFAPPYRKIHLVMFGEYIPFEHQLPFLRHLVPGESSLEPGEKPVLFEFKGIKLGTAICFEDTFAHLTRNLTKEGSDVLVNLTNDAWFKESPGSEMHAANAVFRTIETRKPMIRCTNHGMTQIIDSSGKIISSIPPFKDGFLNTSIQVVQNREETFYVKHGDWLVWICLLITLGGFGLAKPSLLAYGRTSQQGQHQ